MALVVTGDLGATHGPWWAYGLPLLGMLGLSAGTVLDRRWRSTGGLIETMATQTVVVAALVLAGVAAAGDVTPPMQPSFWWAVGWVVVLSTFGGYGCYFLVLRRSGPTRVSTLLYLTPPTTMLWAAVAFGDRPGGWAYAGSGVCVVAVVIVLRGQRAQLLGTQRRTLATAGCRG